MPLLTTLGNASAKGFGWLSAVFKNWAQPNWVSGAANNTIGVVTESGNIYDSDWGGHFVKYNGAGAVQWQRTFTTPGGLRFGCMGGYSATGFSAAGYDFGNGLATAVDYDPSGTLQWQKTLSVIGGPYGILKNNGGSTLIVGTGTVSSRSSGIFLSLTSSGSVAYQLNMNMPATGASIEFNSIAYPGGSTYYIHGRYYNGTTPNQFQPLLVKISNPDGQAFVVDWQRVLTATAAGEAIQAQDIVYSSGDDSVIITGGGGTSTGYSYIAKFSSTGNLTWIKRPTRNSSQIAGRGVAVDTAGNIYQTLSDPSENGYLIKYDSSGNVLFTKSVSNGPRKVVVSQSSTASDGVYFNIANPASGHAQLFKTPRDGNASISQTGYKYVDDTGTWVFTSSTTGNSSSLSVSNTVTVTSTTAGGTSATTTTAQPALVKF